MKILWNKIRSNLWNSKWLNTWKEHNIVPANYVPAQGAELNSFLLIWTCLLFLSDTGTTPPESGIFGFMINFSAFLVIACASLISITKLEWNPKEKDYVYHVVSAICEWTVAFGFIFYFLTFIHDFQSVTLRISTEINGDV
uniref:DNA damage regulated autophagy modulator 1 n=1 Tax=Ovis aries TaxID=9940 RepID=A0AC11DJQ1_SHEEP